MRSAAAVAVIAVGLALVLVLQNAEPVIVHLFVWHFRASLALWLFVAFALGYIAHLFVTLSIKIRSRR